jgi:hypothetical protein
VHLPIDFSIDVVYHGMGTYVLPATSIIYMHIAYGTMINPMAHGNKASVFPSGTLYEWVPHENSHHNLGIA